MHGTLFPQTARNKFRGTHLRDDEEFYDAEDEDGEEPPSFAWSYGNYTKRSKDDETKFEAELAKNSAKIYTPHDAFTGADAERMMAEAIVK